MAQWVKHLPHKREDTSLDSQRLHISRCSTFICHLSEVTVRMAMELENPGETQEPASLMCT